MPRTFDALVTTAMAAEFGDTLGREVSRITTRTHARFVLLLFSPVLVHLDLVLPQEIAHERGDSFLVDVLGQLRVECTHGHRDVSR